MNAEGQNTNNGFNPRNGSTPNTPNAKSHEEINAIARTLAQKYGLPLVERPRNWSPKAADNKQAEQCYERIRYLYFKNRELLQRRLREFEEYATSRGGSEALSYLLEILYQDAANKLQLTGSGSSRGAWPDQQNPTLFMDKLRNDRSSKWIASVKIAESAPKLNSSFYLPVQPVVESNSSHYDQPTTPTDGDEEFETPPQSPSLRAQPIPRQASIDTKTDRNLNNAVGNTAEDVGDVNVPRKKRLYEETGSDSGATVKYKRTSGDSLLNRSQHSTFPPEAESHEQIWRPRSPKPAVPASANTSFASTVPQSDVSFSTSGRNGTSSVWTSFTSNASGTVERDDSNPPCFSSGECSTDYEAWNEVGSKYDRSFDRAWRGEVDPVEREVLSQPMNDLRLGDDETEPTIIPPVSDIAQARPLSFNNSIDRETKLPSEHYQVRDLPASGLFMDPLPQELNEVPFPILYECARVALFNGVKITDALPVYNQKFKDYNLLWDSFTRNPNTPKLPPRCSTRAWDAAHKGFDNITLRGSLKFNPSNIGPVFKLELKPLLTEVSCRFQRVFGGDRFLYLEVPPLESRVFPSHLKQQQERLVARYTDWLNVEKDFLGRVWAAFHVGPRKGKKSLRREEESQGQRVVLFAMRGQGLFSRKSYPSEPLRNIETDLSELFEWFFPLDNEKNRQQSYCKAYARLDMGFSQTVPALAFRPHQMRWGTGDKRADGTPECERFNDVDLQWQDMNCHDSKTVMNDGCSVISVGAARRIWSGSKWTGPVPSVFQARIGGCKGVWMLSSGLSTEDPEHLDVWIELTSSQTKFEPSAADRSDVTFDQNRLTFEILNYSRRPKSDKLHVAFLPILQDRGVPADALIKKFRENLDYEREKLLQAIEHPVLFRKWINELHAGLEERNRDYDMAWLAGLPAARTEQVILLLEAGFVPTSLSFLADVTFHLIRRHLAELKQRSFIRLAHSTSVLGVADPLGVLEPGEIHLIFASGFEVESTGERLSSLDQKEVLVARHPSLRRSDIQKVRAVYKTELSHLVDVVVFPSKGNSPLAAKLQGGDYDGDTFWICWDPELVKPFKNAPPPSRVPLAETFGIEVDRRTVEQISGPTNSMQEFFRKSFEFKCKPNFLGMATNFHGRLAYWENSIHTPGVNRMADFHSHLIDSAKNGYSLEESKYYDFIRTVTSNRSTALPDPAFKKAMALAAQPVKQRKRSDPDREKKRPAYKRDHVIDQIYFTVIEPHTEDTSDQLRKILQHASDDKSLEEPYKIQRSEASDAGICSELDSLVQRIKKLREVWDRLTHKKENESDPEAYDRNARECHEKYTKMMPENVSHPIIKSWTTRFVQKGLTHWEILKASALFATESKRDWFVFLMAGRELAYIKAHSSGNARSIVHGMWAEMKPRKSKRAGTRAETLADEVFGDDYLGLSDEDYLEDIGDEAEYVTAREAGSDNDDLDYEVVAGF